MAFLWECAAGAAGAARALAAGWTGGSRVTLAAVGPAETVPSTAAIPAAAGDVLGAILALVIVRGFAVFRR